MEASKMRLDKVQEIERAIATLTAGELDELYAWLRQSAPQPIDVQLEADLAAGRIDDRLQRALIDHAAGKTRPL